MTLSTQSYRRTCAVVCLLAVCVVLMSTGAATNDVDRAAAAITPAHVRAEIDYIASDALQGRNTPSAGLDSAAEYVARKFAGAGLQPVHGSYFQRFNLNIVSLGDTNELEITTPATREKFALKDDFIPFEGTADRTVEGGVVFAGYGISAPEYLYDDYAGIDVRGKIVFVLRHEPGEEDTASVFKGRMATEYSNVATKVRQAREHGAIGVLVATDPLNHTNLTPRGFPWPSLSKFLPKDALPLSLGVEEGEKLPVVHVGEGVIRSLLGSVDSLRALQTAIDRSFNSRSFLLRDVRVRLHTSTAIRQMATRNVVAMLPGSDPVRRNECVVVGAHYDHVGVRRNSPAGEDSIYNGADDNGSGTVALMEVAAALGALKGKSSRSILLIAFAGEEKGLFGSEYYVRHPLFPLDSTIAMLNMDMVGRNAEDSLLIIGAPDDSFLARVTRKENTTTGFVLTNTQITSGGSDHQSFQKRKVPSIFYHSDLHKDYHQVSDEAKYISEKKIARVATLVFRTAWAIATSTDAHTYPPLGGMK